MSDEKKIIVDEDWKSQVAAEKEALARQRGAEAPSAPSEPASAYGEPASAGGRATQGAASPTERPPLPPASFEMLVTALATEAMIGLGQIPHPLTGQMHADAEQARYAIDMLEMLAEKTKGNLTPGEDRGLGDLLHQLRMAFIATKGRDERSAPQPGSSSTTSG